MSKVLHLQRLASADISSQYNAPDQGPAAAQMSVEPSDLIEHEDRRHSRIGGKFAHRHPATRPLRPLLPKTPVEPSPTSAVPTAPARQGCGLPPCPNPNCKLKSHKLYALTLEQRNANKSNTTSSKLFRVFPIDWNDQSAAWVDRRLSDGIPDLPEGTQQIIHSKALFHHFFTNQMDKVRQIYIPFVEAEAYRQSTLSMALTSSLHCVCILANAQTDIVMRRQSLTPGRTSFAVYGLAATFLRRKLDKFTRLEIDFLLMLVVALAGLDFAFDRVEALEAHRSALKRLVDLQGGLNVVDDYQSQVVAYVSKTDHMLATAIGKLPLFNHEFGSENFKLPDTPSGIYGSTWRNSDTLKYIDEDVVNLCLDSCRLIYIAETEGITFYKEASPPAETQTMPFFVCLRGRLGVDYGRLYALYHENQTSDKRLNTSKSRCLVVACVLTDYPILWGDYYLLYRHRQATVLQNILLAQDADEWADCLDMLTWIYFVLTSALPRAWRGHKRAVELLRHLLIRKYNGAWPQSGWEEREANNLNNHIWSRLAYHERFEQTCKELVEMQQDSAPEEEGDDEEKEDE